MQLSNQRSQSAKPSLAAIPQQRTIHSAVPKTAQYTRTQSGTTRIGSAASKSIATELFEVIPREVVFSNIEVGVKYESFITVRNLTRHPCRIRVTQPKTLRFRVDFDMQQGIAAGLAMKILVMFQTKVVDDFKDSILVQSDDFQVEVRLAAEKPYPQYQFDRFLDFGFVRQGSENTRALTIINNGALGKVQFKSDLPHLRVQPTLIVVEPKAKAEVQVLYRAQEMGTFRGSIDVIHERGVEKLDVAATSVDYMRMLLDLKGAQVTILDFGEFYIGKQKSIKVKYVNNSPISYQYRIFTRKGLHSLNEELINLQTPNQLGVEQSERIVSVTPDRGFIQGYSQISLDVVCQANLTAREQMQAKNFCFSEKMPEVRDYKYSIVFNQPDEDLVVHVSAKALLPMVRCSKQTLNFGECQVNDNKDIVLNLTNIQGIPVEAHFTKISGFFFKPEKVQVPAFGQTSITITFAPKNVGHYCQAVELVLNDYVRIPLKALAEVSKIAPKRPLTRGPEAKAEDFVVEPKFVDTQQLEYQKKRNNDLLEIHQVLPQKGTVDGFFVDTQKAKSPTNNLQTQGDYLQDQRSNRLEKQRKQILESRVQAIQKQAKEKPVEDGTKPPKDYEFELGLAQETPDNDIEIPYKKDTLFVVKPIYQYEPLKKQEEEIVEFKPDPTTPVRRLLSARPQSHKQVRDIHRELTAEDLKKIQCGPIKIEFGTIYINSVMHRTFTVKNDLRYAISCRMIVDKEELKHTFQDPQIIDSGQQGLFQIGLCAQGLGQYKQIMKYILNERHTFEILVVANVETVRVEVSKTQLKFQFNEESTAMSVSETIKLTNNGVGPASFGFHYIENTKFSVEPLNGVIQPSSFTNVVITYIPSKMMKDPQNPESDALFKQQNPVRQDEEKIVLKVKDGSEISIKCVGLVNDIRCISKNTLELGEVCICTVRSQTFQVKNTTRNNAAFKILTEYLPSGCSVIPASGKIAPDDNKEFTLRIEAKQARSIESQVLLMLRSGRVVRIPLSAQCIIPNIFIKEEFFDFGDVTTLGNQTPLPLTIVNKSEVEAELLFDLRGEDLNPEASEGVDCLVVKQTNPDLLKSFVEEGQQSDQEDEDENAQQRRLSKLVRQNKLLCLKVEKQTTLTFSLHFYPKDLKEYRFYLPIQVHHFGPIDSLRRLVIVRACQPKFVVEPKGLDFGRKIILTPPEKNKASIQEILLSNPESYSIQFRIVLDGDDKIFSIIPLAGRVDAGQTLRVKAMFNPRYDGQYTKQAQIYLEDSKPNQPYLIVHMQGLAAKPSIQFDRRELLLCPVPLSVECRQVIRVFNDGFEAQKLGFKQLDGFTAEFIDGQAVGITRKHLDILIKFQSSSILSITSQLEIVDETQHSYGIPISGTADNCTFTIFPYLEAEQQKYNILIEGKNPPNLIELAPESEDSDSGTAKPEKYRKPTHCLSQKLLDKKCAHFCKWFNHYVGKLDNFPGSVVQANGQPYLDLIQFLTGKTQLPKANLDGVRQRTQIVQLLYTQYKDLLYLLKQEGALLNQIRPHYLLSYEDYLLYLKTSESKFVHPQYAKLSIEHYQYVHQLTHLTVAYQILRIYYLSRVNLKSIRQLVPQLYEYAQSNVYSQQEMLLLKWIETQLAVQWKDSKNLRVSSVNSLKDGQYLAALALSYLGSSAQKFFSPLGVQLLKQEQENTRNMNQLWKAFQDVGVETHFDLQDFIEMANPETMLLLMSLFTQLPNFLPKREPLLFQCVLGSVVMKQITLSNPTKEVLAYRVKLEGSPDFSIEEDSVKIEPGQKVQFNIKFTSRISDEQQAQITFCNKPGNKNIVAALVYDLRGIITERVSQKIWTVKSVLYEPKEFFITVQNQFTNSEFGHFQIQVIPVKMPLVIELPKRKKKALSMAEKKKEIELEAKEKQRIERLQNIEPPVAFFCKQESVRLKRGATYELPMQFLPTQFQLQKCLLVFQDPSVGEFQYEIHGTVDPPEVLIEIRPEMQIFIDQVTNFSHHIPFRNPQLQSALKQVDQLTVEKRKILHRQNSNSVGSQKPAQSNPIEDQLFYVSCEEPSSYITADKTFMLINYNQIIMNQTKHSEDGDEEKQNELQKSDSNQNRLNFSMNFKTAVKDYLSHFILMNETKTDVRRIRIQCTSLPKPIKATLEFVAPAREVLVQDIPIVNNTDRDFNLKVTLTGDSRFQVLGETKKKNSKEQIIKKRTNGAVTIQFSPEWVCEVEGTLQIYNPLTNDVYEYILKGKGEEPLSEGHFTIKAIARQPIKQIIKVPNPYDYDLRYSVETDLLNAAGEAEITIPSKTTYDYVLNVNPVISGQFTGQITFTGNGHYRWWTLTLDTDTPKALGNVDLVSPIRKAIAFDIEIANPLPENITYEVVINGEALTGDPWFSVLPGGSSTYQLVFQPLQEGRWKGSVAFLHPKMGEIWYALNLVGEDRGGVRVPQFKTELGKLDKHEVLLENPTGKPITAEVLISNPANFSLEFEGNALVLEPYTLTPVYIVFVPSGLTAHSGEILIKTKEIGKWLYLCFGTGEPPTPFPPLQVVCKAGQSVTQQLEFKNPLKDSLHVQLHLEQEKNGFEILLKKFRISIAPESSLLIPFQFVAHEIAQYWCNITLEMSNHVKWTYPIIGVIESELDKVSHLIQTKCRIPLKMQLRLFLDGLKQAEKVMYKIVDGEQLKKQLKINLPNHVVKNETDPMLFDIVFHPLKPFKLSTELHVKINNGGLWKFKLQINALEPQVDDIIVMESEINKVNKVSFRLTNRFEEFAQFKAYFTPQSNNEFTVEPLVGMLEPFGKKGTEFKVAFKPREYGKRKEAKLIIETDQIYWSYILRGHLPKYVPPQVSKGHLDEQYKQAIQPPQHEEKNWVIENIKRGKQKQT